MPPKVWLNLAPAALPAAEQTPVDCASRGSAEIEIALIGIFFTAGVKPCVQVGVCDGFFAFVGHDVDHAIRAADTGCRAVGTGGLVFAAARAAIWITDKCILNVSAAQGSVGMKTAILGAESRSLIDIRGREHHVYAIGIVRKRTTTNGIADRGFQTVIRQIGCCIDKSVTGKCQVTANVPRGIAIGGVNWIRTACCPACSQNVQPCLPWLRCWKPVPAQFPEVPDEVNVALTD